jgi:hypothetical protein
VEEIEGGRIVDQPVLGVWFHHQLRGPALELVAGWLQVPEIPLDGGRLAVRIVRKLLAAAQALQKPEGLRIGGIVDPAEGVPLGSDPGEVGLAFLEEPLQVGAGIDSRLSGVVGSVRRCVCGVGWGGGVWNRRLL